MKTISPTPDTAIDVPHPVVLHTCLNRQHPLCQLLEQMDWTQLTEADFWPLQQDCPGISLRWMVSLLYLKRLYNLSDADLLAQWIENPYWQYFCGEQYLQHQLPISIGDIESWHLRMCKKKWKRLLKTMLPMSAKIKTPENKARLIVFMKKLIRSNLSFVKNLYGPCLP
jgi:IS5 family transposase